MKLYALAEQYNRVAELLESADDIEALQDTLESLEDAFEDKIESIVKLMRSKAKERDAIDEEVIRLRSRAEKINKEVEWLHTYIESQMIVTGKEHVKSPLFDIKFKLNPPAVNVLDEFVIPQMYFVTKEPVVSLDKRAVMDAMKSGKVIPGVEVVQRKSLQIK